ncbi:Na/Pi cotransporter family protein, partial [Clostridium paraputrificum]
IGDHADNIADLTIEKINKNLKYSKDAIDELYEIYNSTLEALEIAIDSYVTRDITKAKSIIDVEDKIDAYQRTYREKHIQRLYDGKCNAFAGAVFLDLISSFERIGDHSTNITESVL